jgi:hypothetical protein
MPNELVINTLPLRWATPIAASELALVVVRHLMATPGAVEGFLEKLGVIHG